MVALIYKAYYIFFLYYSRSKMEVAWFSSIIAISTALLFVLISISNELGLLEKLDVYLEAGTKLGRKRNIFLYVIIPSCVLMVSTVYYIVFNLAKASKTTGLSELYLFTPTKRDKVAHWVVCISLVVLSFAPTIIRLLMEGKLYQT